MSTSHVRPSRVLIVEDEAIVQLHLRRELTSLGYEVVGLASSAAEAIAMAASEGPDLILMDIKLRGEGDGILAANAIRATSDVAIVFLTAYADEKTVKRTEEVGAVGYIVKPYSRNEVRAVLATAANIRRRMRDLAAAPARDRQGSPRAPGPAFHGMLGQDATMLAVFNRISDVARLNWTVLVEGQTGTGKELTARALHAESPRAQGPFVPVNCAGLTDTLLASQLFGHKRGAFTGAISDQAGCFEAADGGTLFLDEIADISAAAQQALLRVLDDGLVQRLGETSTRSVDVRVISATQRDLAQEVAAGRFRADLLFRLRAVRVNLPRLRDRGADVQYLADHFLERATRQSRLPVAGWEPAARAALAAHAWPGNVRELRHAVDHAVLSRRQGLITVDDLPPEIQGGSLGGKDDTIPAGDERTRIRLALERSSGNRAEAARLLGISRATLYRRFTEWGIAERNGGLDGQQDDDA